VTAYREQTVEIALGPTGAFENSHIGTLTCLPSRPGRDRPARRVPADLPAPRLRQAGKPPREPRTPRAVELLRKAIEWQALLASGEAAHQVDLARREGISRVRVTQVMGLLRLAPEIQEHVLVMPETICRQAISERALRPIAQFNDHRQQLATFQERLQAERS